MNQLETGLLKSYTNTYGMEDLLVCITTIEGKCYAYSEKLSWKDHKTAEEMMFEYRLQDQYPIRYTFRFHSSGQTYLVHIGNMKL